MSEGPLKHALTEKEFAKQVESLFKLFGWKYYHTWRSSHSTPGFPDYIALKGSVMIVAELKSEKGQLTEAQCSWLVAFKEANVPTFIFRPSDWDEIVRVLERGDSL